MNVQNARIIQLPKIADPRGNLSIIEQLNQIPFEIRRTYWIYDVPGGFDRGGHAYKENQEVIVALSGSFDVELDDGGSKKIFQLNRSYFALYVPKGIWRRMTNFSTNSLALVLSSTHYDVSDYILDYNEFLNWARYPDIKTTPAKYDPTGDKRRLFDLKECSTVFDCSICRLNRFHDIEGNLTVISENTNVPFDINRVFYSYDIPGGEDRGAHAHKNCHQFIVAASGCFDVVLDDGKDKRTVTLNRPFQGLHVPPGIWASEREFSSGSICLVLASDIFSEDDYIRDYNSFIEYRNKQE